MSSIPPSPTTVSTSSPALRHLPSMPSTNPHPPPPLDHWKEQKSPPDLQSLLSENEQLKRENLNLKHQLQLLSVLLGNLSTLATPASSSSSSTLHLVSVLDSLQHSVSAFKQFHVHSSASPPAHFPYSHAHLDEEKIANSHNGHAPTIPSPAAAASLPPHGNRIVVTPTIPRQSSASSVSSYSSSSSRDHALDGYPINTFSPPSSLPNSPSPDPGSKRFADAINAAMSTSPASATANSSVSLPSVSTGGTTSVVSKRSAMGRRKSLVPSSSGQPSIDRSPRPPNLVTSSSSSHSLLSVGRSFAISASCQNTPPPNAGNVHASASHVQNGNGSGPAMARMRRTTSISLTEPNSPVEEQSLDELAWSQVYPTAPAAAAVVGSSPSPSPALAQSGHSSLSYTADAHPIRSVPQPIVITAASSSPPSLTNSYPHPVPIVSSTAAAKSAADRKSSLSNSTPSSSSVFSPSGSSVPSQSSSRSTLSTDSDLADVMSLAVDVARRAGRRKTYNGNFAGTDTVSHKEAKKWLDEMKKTKHISHTVITQLQTTEAKLKKSPALKGVSGPAPTNN